MLPLFAFYHVDELDLNGCIWKRIEDYVEMIL